MQPVVRHINSEGPSRAVNVFALAGHVTVDAISLSLYGHEAGSTDDLTVPKPRYAQILDPVQPYLIKICTSIDSWLKSLKLKLEVNGGQDGKGFSNQQPAFECISNNFRHKIRSQ